MAAPVDALKKVPLFSDLNQRQLKRLAADFREKRFKEGLTIVREGEMSGIGFFVVGEGVASVSVDGREVATIGPGAHFGELALISEGLRTATVTAVTPLTCYEITFWDFRKAAKANPDITWKLLQNLAELLVEERLRRAQAFATLL